MVLPPTLVIVADCCAFLSSPTYTEHIHRACAMRICMLVQVCACPATKMWQGCKWVELIQKVSAPHPSISAWLQATVHSFASQLNEDMHRISPECQALLIGRLYSPD